MGKRLNLFLFILILISFSANAETYKLQCIYEVGGNKSITIDEQNSKVINNTLCYRIMFKNEHYCNFR